MPDEPLTTDQLRRRLIQVYNAYRTALLNRKYYGHQLTKYRKFNIIFEWVIAAGATGSGVSGFALWETEPGKIIWSVVAGTAIVLATLKPMLNLGKSIERYTTLFTGHGKIYRNLESLVADVAFEQQLTKEMDKRFVEARVGFEDLDQHDDPKPNRKLLQKFQEEVNRQIPAQSLWLPPN